MIESNSSLNLQYQNYLKLAKPAERLAALRQVETFECLLIMPIYCHKFAFTSQFIGTYGKYINQIKQETSQDVNINVHSSDSAIQVYIAAA